MPTWNAISVGTAEESATLRRKEFSSDGAKHIELDGVLVGGKGMIEQNISTVGAAVKSLVTTSIISD